MLAKCLRRAVDRRARVDLAQVVRHRWRVAPEAQAALRAVGAESTEDNAQWTADVIRAIRTPSAVRGALSMAFWDAGVYLVEL